jgi:hypothetical protein
MIRKLESEAPRLREEGKFVSVVISTQGVPTDLEAESTSEIMSEYIQSLKALSELPARITFRLVTGDKKVIDFYKKVDLGFECDVIGDYWDEVCALVVCHR